MADCIVYGLQVKDKIVKYFPSTELAERYAKENKIIEYKVVAITIPKGGK